MFQTIALLALITLGGSHLAFASEPCGSLVNGYGPFDYRTSAKQLDIVEKYHFTSDVESLKHGKAGYLGTDLDYTLRASPNHHRALMAMVNLAFSLNTDKPKGAKYTISVLLRPRDPFRAQRRARYT